MVNFAYHNSGMVVTRRMNLIQHTKYDLDNYTVWLDLKLTSDEFITYKAILTLGVITKFENCIFSKTS